MANAQDVFDAAVGFYASAEKLIQEMGANVPDYKIENGMASFDLILQSVLFRAAINDGTVTANEKVFIQGITKYADFLELVSQAGGQEITWDNIASLDPDHRAMMATLAEDLVDQITTEFIVPLAVVDALDKERDYLSELDDLLLRIFMCFAVIDGEGLKSEMDAAVKTYVRLLSRKWQFCVAATEAATSESEE